MSSDPKQIERSDPSTIQRKFLVGYQGWFTCRGDGAALNDHGWSHWLMHSRVEAGDMYRLATDLWPDLSDYSPSELYPVPGFKHKSGEQALLFSSLNTTTVRRHFNWMNQHGIDGVFLQRFVGQCDPLHPRHKVLSKWRDQVGDNVRAAAEAEGRVFAIMYDVSGVDSGRVQQTLEHDWTHLIRQERLLESPCYLRERGKPVICLWGFGFKHNRQDPEILRETVLYIRENTPGGAYVMAGVPTHWRTGDGDADSNPKFLDLWLNLFDAISPWTVGRYKDVEEADVYAKDIVEQDVLLLNACNKLRRQRALIPVDYVHVVLPGGSGYNMSKGRWAFNNIRREGGRFLWRQIYNACSSGAQILYGATFDEYDEGTALMPAVASKLLLPVSHRDPLMALDEDGYNVPSDWYMRICGLAAQYLRGERRMLEDFPYEALRDYWTKSIDNDQIVHPSQIQLSGSSALHEVDEPPPPPYYGGGSQSIASTPLQPPKNSTSYTATTSRLPSRTASSRPLPPIPRDAGVPIENLQSFSKHNYARVTSLPSSSNQNSSFTRRVTMDSTVATSIGHRQAETSMQLFHARTSSDFHYADGQRKNRASMPQAGSGACR